LSIKYIYARARARDPDSRDLILVPGLRPCCAGGISK